MTLIPHAPKNLLLAFTGAVIVTAVLGSVVQTQLALAALIDAGASIPFAVRVSSNLDDLIGFAPGLAAIVSGGFTVAFAIAARLGHRLPAHRQRLMIAAGGAALLTALALMRLTLGLTAIAAARSPLGVLLLAASGAMGGWVFWRLRRVSAHTQP